MKSPGYYVKIWIDEFTSRMTYHTTGGQMVNEEEVKLARDLARCSPLSDSFDAETVASFRQALKEGFGNRNLEEVARAARLGAKVGKAWCASIVVLAIEYARTDGSELIKSATYESLF